MRTLLCVVTLWASTALAQTDAPASQPAPEAPPAPVETPAAAPQCAADGDCPGALYCVSGQCVQKEQPAAATDDVKVQKVASGRPELKHFGINLDVGFPDGVALGALYRPFYWLRAGAAATYNGIGFGARGMITLAPIDFFITPTLTAEAGHYFGADATFIYRQAFNDPTFEHPALREVSYDYANLHLGLEIGSTQHFLFYLRVGGSYLQSTLKNSGQLLQDQFDDPTLEAGDFTMRITVPSLKLGIVAFF